ncbi:astacin-like metalloendopeptidase isoform X2 [Hyperolius riggenbachi]|uniref:astacin-like metalloendopeptidase isoform X2 n=1 Tax=Hyperolius riggenbachi TaxID=752182 RepID=UPI0035A2FD62
MASHILFLLLSAAVWSFGEALPILSSLLTGASNESDNIDSAYDEEQTISDLLQNANNDESDNIDNAYDDEQTISDLLQNANNDVLNLYQMDMASNFGRGKRKCKTCIWKRSTQGIVQVPYVLSDDYSSANKDLIILAMLEFETMTCVQFIEKTSERSYLDIENGPGCWGYVGRKGWTQPLVLQKSYCMVYSIIQHELMHAIGFLHEHSRTDRDNYLHINWQYISPDEGNFVKDDEDSLGIPYDYSSVMHYGSTIYTNTSGKSTMEPTMDSTVHLGQTVGLSSLDVKRINVLYNCSQCRTKVLGASGTFSSEQATPVKDYDNCLWLLQIPKNLILLQFTEFHSSTNKCNDKVNIYDGGSSNAALLATFYADQPLPALVSSSSFLLLEYITAAPGQSSFSGSYSSVTHGGTYTELSGSISSPKYPFDYPNEASATYVIIAPPGYKISLTLLLVNLEPSPECTKDSLEVRDGGDLTARSLGLFCGLEHSILTFNSRGPGLLLQFSSDGDTTRSGFVAHYQSIQEQRSPINIKVPLILPGI